MAHIITEQSVLASESKIVFYELEKARFIIKDGCGLDIAYAYEDLVVSEHGLFILQFDEKAADSFSCWFNKDCVEADRHSMFKSLTTSAALNGITIKYLGKFDMSQNGDEEQITLKFMKSYMFPGMS